MFKNISILLALYIASLQDIMAAQQQYENRIELYNPGNARVHDNQHNLPLAQMPHPVQYQNNGYYQQQNQNYGFNPNARAFPFPPQNLTPEQQQRLNNLNDKLITVVELTADNEIAKQNVIGLQNQANSLNATADVINGYGKIVENTNGTAKKVRTAAEDSKGTIDYLYEKGSEAITYVSSFIWSTTPTEEKK